MTEIMQTHSSLEQMVLSRSAEERRHLRDLLDRSLTGTDLAVGRTRINELVDAMQRVTGERPVLTCRTPRFVWAKAMIACQMLMEGRTLCEVGEQLGMAHCSVIHLRRKMEDLIANPEFYGDVLKTWLEFQKEIKNGNCENQTI